MKPVLSFLMLMTSGAALAQVPQVAAPVAAGPSPLFGARDVFSLAQASDVQISPDGKRIAYTRATADIMTDGDRRETWIVDVASGRQMPLGAAGSMRARWSPDGSRIAYVARGEGDKPQIFVRWMDSGTSSAVTALPEGPADLAWSPDGRMIGFAMFVPGNATTLGTPLVKPEGAKWAEPIRIIGQVHYREDGGGYLRPGYNHMFVVPADGGAAADRPERQSVRGQDAGQGRAAAGDIVGGRAADRCVDGDAPRL